MLFSSFLYAMYFTSWSTKHEMSLHMTGFSECLKFTRKLYYLILSNLLLHIHVNCFSWNSITNSAPFYRVLNHNLYLSDHTTEEFLQPYYGEQMNLVCSCTSNICMNIFFWHIRDVLKHAFVVESSNTVQCHPFFLLIVPSRKYFSTRNCYRMIIIWDNV